jgi:hypothetical protein
MHEPGYYWIIIRGNDKPTICEVDEVAGHRWVSVIGTDDDVSESDIETWISRISEPSIEKAV